MIIGVTKGKRTARPYPAEGVPEVCAECAAEQVRLTAAERRDVERMNGLVLQWEHQPAIIPKRIAAPLDEFPVLESSTAQEAHPSALTRESA